MLLFTGIIFLVLGLLIGFVAFAFAAYNMYSGSAGDQSFDEMFKGHLGAMVVMAFGSLVSVLGIVLGISHFAMLYA